CALPILAADARDRHLVLPAAGVLQREPSHGAVLQLARGDELPGVASRRRAAGSAGAVDPARRAVAMAGVGVAGKRAARATFAAVLVEVVAAQPSRQCLAQRAASFAALAGRRRGALRAAGPAAGI